MSLSSRETGSSSLRAARRSTRPNLVFLVSDKCCFFYQAKLPKPAVGYQTSVLEIREDEGSEDLDWGLVE